MKSEERQKGITYSAILHATWLFLAIFGLPALLRSTPPEEPMAITVELLPITGITNVKPSENTPSPEEKPEEKKPEPKKPTPPVKTKEAPPPVPDPENPSPIPPKEKKETEKKPDEKKDDKKDKAKEEDLEAVLKAVRDTAQKEKKDDSKDKSADSNKSKSKSTQYNEGLPLSISEKDAIRSQIAKCWNVAAGAKDAHELVVVLELSLAQDGTVLKVELASESKARYDRDSFFRAAADSAVRAVRQCSPLKSLPPDKYDTWREMELSFDPKEMLF